MSTASDCVQEERRGEKVVGVERIDDAQQSPVESAPDQIRTENRSSGSSSRASLMGNGATPVNSKASPQQAVHTEALHIQNDKDFSIPRTGVRSIVVEPNICNAASIVSWDLSSYSQLRILRIGASSFKHVTTFHIDGLKELETVEVGERCFTSFTRTPDKARAVSFVIANCPKLKSIVLGRLAFADWGEFRLSSWR